MNSLSFFDNGITNTLAGSNISFFSLLEAAFGQRFSGSGPQSQVPLRQILGHNATFVAQHDQVSEHISGLFQPTQKWVRKSLTSGYEPVLGNVLSVSWF